MTVKKSNKSGLKIGPLIMVMRRLAYFYILTFWVNLYIQGSLEILSFNHGEFNWGASLSLLYLSIIYIF